MKAFLFTFEALLFTVSCQKSHIFLAREGVETNKIYLLLRSYVYFEQQPDEVL